MRSFKHLSDFCKQSTWGLRRQRRTRNYARRFPLLLEDCVHVWRKWIWPNQTMKNRAIILNVRHLVIASFDVHSTFGVPTGLIETALEKILVTMGRFSNMGYLQSVLEAQACCDNFSVCRDSMVSALENLLKSRNQVPPTDLCAMDLPCCVF